MKRITLAVMMVLGATTLWAQVPPTPPAQPARPVPTPAPAPVARPARPIDIDEMRMRIEDMRLDRLDRLDLEPARRAMEEVRAHQLEINQAAREASRLALQDMRSYGRTIDEARATVEALRDTPFPPMAPMPAMAPMARAYGAVSDGFHLPSPQWIQGDPADSAYRFAHDILNRGDYGRAAQLFKDIAAKYPKSSYQNDLPYWEAYARYKIGTTDELHTSAKLLEPRASKLIGTTTASGNAVVIEGRGFGWGRRGTSDNDAVNLYIRVNSVLAQRGDRAAADVVATAAKAGANTCDREDMDMRAEALSALSQMDPAAALPQVKKVLGQKDECSVSLRRRAVFMLGRRGDAEAATQLGVTAKSDPSVSVRSDAITWLPKLQGDAGVAVLEDLLRTEQDENIQRSVVHTLVASDNVKARTSMRALIERKDAPLNLRIEAINSYNNDRTTADDATFLRSFYGRADNDRLKEAVVGALGRVGGQENDAFVLGIIKNPNEPSQVRSQAISRMMSKNMPIADVGKLYDAADSRNVRIQLVNMLERRQEPEAADKLYDIAKNSTDQQVKTQAFRALVNRKDERTKQLLNEILEGGKKPPA
jgi:TolA-binding protein/HEAT repeat protein